MFCSEIKEEIGFDILSENLHKIGTRKHMVNHPNGIIDNEFHHVFIAELTVSVEDLTLQEEEVAELKLFPLETILHTKDYKNVLLPQYQDYYSFVHNQIVKKLSIL